MNRFVVHLSTYAIVLLLWTAIVRAQEEPVSPNKIPKAVVSSLLARFPGAKIDKCTRAREEGTVVYDIEFKQNGRKCESDIKENGGYINFEKAIKAGDLPKAVRGAIEKKYPNAALKEIMVETEVKGKQEKLSAYEVVLSTPDNIQFEVRFSPEGKTLESTVPKKPSGKK